MKYFSNNTYIFSRYLLPLLIFLNMGANCYARSIVLLTHFNQDDRIALIKKILIEEQNVPTEFIAIERRSNPCQGREDSLLWLCIDEQKEMRIMKVSPYLTKGNFNIFKEEKPDA